MGLSLLFGLIAEGPHALPRPTVLAAPLVFLALPLLQIIPLPVGLVSWANRASFELLRDVGATRAFMRWSLDWPATTVEALKAAACLSVFMVSSRTAASSSRRSPSLMVKAVASAGMASLLVGLGHRIFGMSLVYGHFGEARPLLNGPFVNPNHNAEFLELGAFASLSLALAEASLYRRLSWAAASICCAAGAIATLSRGSLLALTAGSIVLATMARLNRVPAGQLEQPRRAIPGPRRLPSRSPLPWVLGGILALLALALAFGATALVGRFSGNSPFADGRFGLWRDALRVLAVHPMGIGGGAFDRVYPVYRALLTLQPVRFTHAENQPLQFLIEYGWPGLIVASLAIAAMVVSLRPRARVLPISSLALAGGLMAVVVHNLVDFGMELLGVALPWYALLGTLAGRERRSGSAVASRDSHAPRTSTAPRAFALGVGGLAVFTTLLLVPMMYSPNLRDFDALIRRALTPEDRRQLAVQAQGPHPTDYFYPLVEATATGSPRGQNGWQQHLRLLNHALRLCGECADVHLEVARTLWSLARRKQAVIEYQTAIGIQPYLLSAVTDEIWRNGGNPIDLIELAGGRPERTVRISTFLLDIGAPAAALTILDAADPRAALEGDDAVLRGRAALQQGKPRDGEIWLRKAISLLPTDPGIAIYLAQALESNGKVDDALRTLEASVARFPADYQSARARLELLTRHHRWSTIEEAIDVFKEALQKAQLPTTDAHLAAARIYLDQGRVTDSLREYQLASVQRPEDVALLIEYARVADRAGRTTTATLLLGEASTLSPNNQDARLLLQQIADRRHETLRNASEYNQFGGPN